MTKRWYPALAAAAACIVCYVAGWRGTDWAAQLYRASEVAHYGLVVWDPGWYAGVFPFGYSLLYPLVAGGLGLWPVALLSAAGAAFCFDSLVTTDKGRRPAGSWYFAVSTVIEVAIGQLPTLAAEALALGCILCLVRYWDQGPSGWLRGRGRVREALLAGGIALGVLAALTSPVAGLFLALSLGAWGLACAVDGRKVVLGLRPLALIGAAALVMLATVGLPILFPQPGYFPFGAGDVLVVLVICALLASPWLALPLPVRLAAVLYGAATIGFFLVPNPMGDNDARFGAYIGVPLVLCYLPPAARRLTPHWQTGRRWAFPFMAGVVPACLAVWHWGPIVASLGVQANGPASQASFYQPLIAELTTLAHGEPARVEIPPLDHHWESAYVAAAFPLARGWERQLDMAYDPLFYAPGPLRASTYRSWLLSEGVSYVALSDAPLDYSAVAEAALLRSGSVPGLVRVWHTSTWTVWKVAGSPGLASAPGQVTSIAPTSVVVRFSRPGSSVVRVRWSDYWSVATVPGGRPACAQPSPAGWTDLTATGPGPVELTISPFGPKYGRCPSPGNTVASTARTGTASKPTTGPASKPRTGTAEQAQDRNG